MNANDIPTDNELTKTTFVVSELYNISYYYIYIYVKAMLNNNFSTWLLNGRKRRRWTIRNHDWKYLSTDDEVNKEFSSWNSALI